MIVKLMFSKINKISIIINMIAIIELSMKQYTIIYISEKITVEKYHLNFHPIEKNNLLCYVYSFIDQLKIHNH